MLVTVYVPGDIRADRLVRFGPSFLGELLIRHEYLIIYSSMHIIKIIHVDLCILENTVTRMIYNFYGDGQMHKI